MACVRQESVGATGFASLPTMNNLAKPIGSVDKCFVVPEASPGLSTGAKKAQSKAPRLGGGVALWHKGNAVTCATARSEMPGVAQLQEVLARIGLFQAGVGTVLDAQLPFVLLLRTMQVAHGQV